MDRWRGRRVAGLAVLALVAAATLAAVALGRGGGAGWIVVRDANGTELARVALTPANAFAMRYRNSVYQSNAEEHFRVQEGHVDLVALAADELAVLEEYYAAIGAIRDRPGSTLVWSVGVERPPIALPLRVQATTLGERTLLVGDGELSLSRLVAGRDDTLVILTIEGYQ